MRKPAIALTIAVVVIAAAAGVATAVSSTGKPSTAVEHSVTNQDQRADDQDEDIEDVEEPFISDEPPQSAADYVQQARPGSQTVDGPPVASESAVSSDGEGWTGRSPS
ncbi:hypothetical protein ACGFIU_15435 [Rhodococcus oryzae]|uniref:hypothetical protein n=1 Tax=Rhodococcus oryzae TaxID=2571143 RepID=UPI003718A363